MTTPHNHPALLKTWKNYRLSHVRQKLSLRQTCLELAQKYDCHPETVRFYLDPSVAEKSRESGRKSEQKRYAKYRHRKLYERFYRRITRNPARYLTDIFQAGSESDLLTITEKLSRITEGTKFRPQTIKRILRKYELEQQKVIIRGPPYLSESHDGVWTFSGS